ncbi:hypothetical protein Ate01nite_35600 [Actinoplanes teichomyceticus]|nr:hypothetical protein Ate01nite_35600 [Actinoplanes teichomyceticus]
MTVTVLNVERGRAGLLEKLLAAVRAEFRTEIYRPRPDDPVFASPPCTVSDCDRPVIQSGLCNAHAIRWRQRGHPDMHAFLADPPRPGPWWDTAGLHRRWMPLRRQQRRALREASRPVAASRTPRPGCLERPFLDHCR